MRFASHKTFLEIISSLLVNLSSGWFAALVVAPGFFKVTDFNEYLSLLLQNLPFGIVSLLAALSLAEKSKHL